MDGMRKLKYCRSENVQCSDGGRAEIVSLNTTGQGKLWLHSVEMISRGSRCAMGWSGGFLNDDDKVANSN